MKNYLLQALPTHTFCVAFSFTTAAAESEFSLDSPKTFGIFSPK